MKELIEFGRGLYKLWSSCLNKEDEEIVDWVLFVINFEGYEYCFLYFLLGGEW